MPGDEGYPEEAPPEDEYECYGCGTFYEMPNACEIELSVLCRNCLSITVHVDPEDVPDSWPCTAPGNEECDSDEEPQCLLGTRYECIDNTWKMAAECDDQCCEEGCTSISEDHDDEGPESSEEEED